MCIRDRYSVATELPERAVRRIGFSLMDNHPDEATKILLTNSKNNPQSPGALFALARSYENNDVKQSAMKSYQAALALAEKQSASSVDFLKRQVARYKKVLAEG